MEHFLEKVWPHIKDFYKSPGTKEDSKGDNQDKTEEPVKVYTTSDSNKPALWPKPFGDLALWTQQLL